MQQRFLDKVIVMTGHSSGIGKAIREAFEREGAKVYGFSREDGDVRNKDEVEQWIDAIVRERQQIDVVVTSAGVYHPSQTDIETMSVDDFDLTMDVNVKGTFLVIKYALPYLKKSKGSIITIASAIGLSPEADSPIYCASKAAVIMLTKTLALRYAKDGIRVNSICPGPIDTPMLRSIFTSEADLQAYASQNPMQRIGTPEEVASLALFLASDEASYITGDAHIIDGGQFIV